MDDVFLKKMEDDLLKLKAEIITSLANNGESFMESAPNLEPKDEVDIASDDIDRRLIEALGAAEMKRFKLIDNAIARIKTGKYGLCVKCGTRIPQSRLEAIPYAILCVECKSAEERRNR
jgi:RNA polymerase-binding protein DksA